jgi:xanthine dehydrogenase molybdopterin-binding subunit B
MLPVTCTLNIFTHRFTAKDELKPYNIYGVTVGEVEVDLLTGQQQVSCLWTLLLCVDVDFIVMC